VKVAGSNPVVRSKCDFQVCPVLGLMSVLRGVFGYVAHVICLPEFLRFVVQSLTVFLRESHPLDVQTRKRRVTSRAERRGRGSGHSTDGRQVDEAQSESTLIPECRLDIRYQRNPRVCTSSFEQWRPSSKTRLSDTARFASISGPRVMHW
jgi:hypothetical protein